MNGQDLLAVADRLFAAIEAGDVDAVRDCYTDDVTIWHNFDQRDQSGPDNLATLAWMVGRLNDRRYEIVRRELLGDGGSLLQQHVLHGTVAATGARLVMPAAMIITGRDGRISRLEEYLDTAQAAVLRGAQAGPAS
jgi:ketosteroid isomerase-like protein